MRLRNVALWESAVKKNTDPYGKACIDVARKVMELLEKDDTPLHHSDENDDIHSPHGLICIADKEMDAGGITGFMAGVVAQLVSQCHERGEEFRKIWNNDYDGPGVVNPAILTIKKTP